MTVPHAAVKWRKSSMSSGTDTCVELAYVGAVRDSKNPGGPVLVLPLDRVVAAAKSGRFSR